MVSLFYGWAKGYVVEIGVEFLRSEEAFGKSRGLHQCHHHVKDVFEGRTGEEFFGHGRLGEKFGVHLSLR